MKALSFLYKCYGFHQKPRLYVRATLLYFGALCWSLDGYFLSFLIWIISEIKQALSAISGVNYHQYLPYQDLSSVFKNLPIWECYGGLNACRSNCRNIVLLLNRSYRSKSYDVAYHLKAHLMYITNLLPDFRKLHRFGSYSRLYFEAYQLPGQIFFTICLAGCRRPQQVLSCDISFSSFPCHFYAYGSIESTPLKQNQCYGTFNYRFWQPLSLGVQIYITFPILNYIFLVLFVIHISRQRPLGGNKYFSRIVLDKPHPLPYNPSLAPFLCIF